MSNEPPCLICNLRRLCVGEGLDAQALSQMSFVRCRRTPVLSGHSLVWEGDQFDTLYAVRSGVLKSMSMDAEGNERVRGFHFPGELIGLDALHGGVHLSSVESLTDSEICELPFSSLDRALQNLPPLRRHLMGLLSRHLAIALSQCGDFTAEQRIAAFLIDMAYRQSPPSTSPPLRLDMSRRDIANYLRLATETVSRVLTRLRGCGVIALNRRQVRIVNLPSLKGMAGSLAQQGGSPTQLKWAA